MKKLLSRNTSLKEIRVFRLIVCALLLFWELFVGADRYSPTHSTVWIEWSVLLRLVPRCASFRTDTSQPELVLVDRWIKRTLQSVRGHYRVITKWAFTAAAQWSVVDDWVLGVLEWLLVFIASLTLFDPKNKNSKLTGNRDDNANQNCDCYW